MFGILVSAFYTILGWIFQSVILKFLVAFSAYYAVRFAAENLSLLIPDSISTNINSSLNAIPSGVWYFLNVFAFAEGLTILISAAVSAFLIRRLPLMN